MNMKRLTLIVATLVVAGAAHAAPNVNKSGECYTFKNDQLSNEANCAISIEYDRDKGKSTSLKLLDRSYNINAEKNGKNYLDFRFTVDGMKARHYLRNASTNKQTTLSELESVNGDALDCYKSPSIDLCHN